MKKQRHYKKLQYIYLVKSIMKGELYQFDWADFTELKAIYYKGKLVIKF